MFVRAQSAYALADCSGDGMQPGGEAVILKQAGGDVTYALFGGCSAIQALTLCLTGNCSSQCIRRKRSKKIGRMLEL